MKELSDMYLPASVKAVMDRLEDAGHEVYLVGGCVRDTLLDRAAKDYDLATDARPDQMQALFEKTVLTGARHGTVTVLTEDGPAEVTTFRREGTYSDARHPDSVEFVGTIEEDLARRDFTVNAMAWNPSRGLVDPFGGRKDLKAGLIRAVGDPDRRFQEDALRMIRAHRFAARYGFAIEENTRQAISRNEDRIAQVAVERLYGEWMEILKTDPKRIADMTGLFRPWIPELEEAARTPQNSPYHYTGVLAHILDSVSYLEPFDETLALTLLLHDLGKPGTRTTSKNGRDHFRGHPELSRDIARRVVSDLKLSSRQKKVIPELVLHHDDILGRTPEAIFRLRVKQGWSDEWVKMLYAVQYCDIMAHSDKGRQRLERWKASKEYYEAETARRPLSFSELAISGHDILAVTGLRNRQVRCMLDAVLAYAFHHPEQNTRLDLLTFVLRNRLRIAGDCL